MSQHVNLFINKKHPERFLFTCLIVCITLAACRKTNESTATISNPETTIEGKFSTGEITRWDSWYGKAVKNAPRLMYENAQEAIIRNRYYIRIPLENSTGMVYFTKTNSLQAVFIRTTIKNGKVSDAAKQNMEFIDLNNFNYQVVTYKNKKWDSLYTTSLSGANDAIAGNIRLQGTVRTHGTFWFDLACILTFGIPRWNDQGERECYGFNVIAWLASVLAGDAEGGGSNNYTIIGTGNTGGNGGGEINNGPGGNETPGGGGGPSGEPGVYIPVFGGDPANLVEAWQDIDDDFYSEDDEEDLENPDGEGDFAFIPHSITLNNGQVVTVTFGMTLDLDHADHMVSQRLIDALIATLNACSGPILDIHSIHIKSTSNGGHSPASNHYKRTALDISQINGKPIILMNGGTGNAQTLALQTEFENVPHRRENFGPHFKHKLGVQKDNVKPHKDHLHFSVNGY